MMTLEELAYTQPTWSYAKTELQKWRRNWPIFKIYLNEKNKLPTSSMMIDYP
jgi:hypothetical protein